MQPLFSLCYKIWIEIKRCKASFIKTTLICVALLVGLPLQSRAQRLDVFIPNFGLYIYDTPNNPTGKRWGYKIYLGGWGLIFDKRFPSNRTGWSWAFPFYYTGPYTTTQVSINAYFLVGAVRKYSHDFTQNVSLDLSLGGGLVVNHQWKLNPAPKQENPSNHTYPTPVLMLYLNSKNINGTSGGINFLFFYQRGLKWWFPEIQFMLTFPIPLPPKKTTK